MMRATRIVRSSGYTLARQSLPPIRASFHSSAKCLKLQDEFPDLDPQQMEKLLQNSLVLKVAKSPKAQEALENTVKILNEKGYMGDLGVMKQIKLLMDKDVKREFLNVKKVLEDEGIELKKEDIEGLTDLMRAGSEKK